MFGSVLFVSFVSFVVKTELKSDNRCML